MCTRHSQSNPEPLIEAARAFSGRFTVLPAPGLAFWRWDEASLSLCPAPEWSGYLAFTGEEAAKGGTQPWWLRLADEDRALLDKACAECLAGSGSSVDLTVRARGRGKGWGWVLVRGGLVASAGKERELAGYAVDVSRLRTDKGLSPPAGGVFEKPPVLAEFPFAFSPRPPAGSPSFQLPFRPPPLPGNGAAKAEVWDIALSDELLAFHQRNIATVLETGATVKETASLHTSLRGETIGEYHYFPEFGLDGAVCGVICQMRDLTMPTYGEQEKLLSGECADDLNDPGQVRNAPEEENPYMLVLEQARKAAETANRAKNEFLAKVSHELRTPLNGVLAMLQLLQLSALAGEQLEYVRAANLSGQALLHIISDILDFSRMESGKMELRDSAFDLRETLLSAMDPFVLQARSKGLETFVSIDEKLPAALRGDDARVRQIIFNLVGNALKFTQQGCIGLECSVLPHSVHDTVRVYIAVRDTGIGIPQQAHAVIFDPFTQLDSASVQGSSGTGLGLGIVRHLMRMMGGTLALESEPGEGTTIHCSLPFARTDKRLAERRKGDRRRRCPSRAVNGGRRLDVLVAEDDSVGRFALRTFLLRAGHRAVCVETGRQALEALQLHAFDCLITDIQMPVMDGLETARRIRQGHFADIRPSREVVEAVRQAISQADGAPRAGVSPAMPVIALTAHVMNGDREYFLRMGMDMYLAKPVVMEDLYALLDRVTAAARGGKNSEVRRSGYGGVI